MLAEVGDSLKPLTNMQTTTLKQRIARRLLLFVLPALALIGFAVPSAQAGPYRGGRSGGARHAYRGGGYRGGYHGAYRGGYGGRGYRYGGYRGHRGYYRYYHGHRYWYEDGGFFLYPGGTSVNIVL